MAEDTTFPRTLSDEAPPRSAPRVRPQLVLLANADLPQAASSRHLLDDIDEVELGRGERAAIRVERGGRRVLELRLLDPRVSKPHGRLLRGASGWVLDDPGSKNGTLIDGVVTRRAAIGDGALIELGRSFLLFREAPVEPGAPVDLGDADLAGRAPAAALHTPALHTPALHTPALHTPALHTPALHAPALHTYDGALAERFAELIRVAARPEVCVLLQGEPGTGKEVVARALHAVSGRSGAFVAVSCGAVGDRPGLIRSADGGTLFLDDIGELPAASQAALLRALQDCEVMPVGGARPIKVEVRLCAATQRDLAARVAGGQFREDLRDRLAGLTLELPALRLRRADLGLLIRRLLARIPGGPEVKFAPSTLRALLRYPWPGNLRELERTLQTAVALTRAGMIEAAALPEAIRCYARPDLSTGGSSSPAVSAPARATPRSGDVDRGTDHGTKSDDGDN